VGINTSYIRDFCKEEKEPEGIQNT
jgi:hypothetical protein